MNRLDVELVKQLLVSSRSQAEHIIKLGHVRVNGRVVIKPAMPVSSADKLEVIGEQTVSRAGLKLASVASDLQLDFEGKTVLDVGSSTGGFTEFALKNGAKLVIAVDVGTNQLHPSLQGHPQIELHEKTDIRDFVPTQPIDIVVMDVSFISVRQILPHIARIVQKKSVIVVMLKPQFEAGKEQVNKGVIKNDTVRRKILKDFEQWSKKYFLIVAKADSKVAGAKGNLERFYVLRSV
jgi:23S rRNA (cytidine1920-2'-O)/16S rRNA (cytidine1409-2'-O)-methyltransferase